MADRAARLAFILSLTDKVSAPLGKVKTSFSELAAQGEKNIKQVGLGLAGMVGAGVAITESLEPALEMNRALGEVRAFGVAEDALTALNAKALEFSVNYATSAEAFVASSRTINGAIKGLVGGQLAAVTGASALLAKATKADEETTAAYVGTMYNLFKGQADAMGKLEWIEQLTGQTALAVKLFRTDGDQIKDAFKEVGQVATSAGVSLAEQFAVIGTLSSTMEGGDAGGFYKSFFENVGAGATKLGLSFTDANDRLLPMETILAKLQGKIGDLNSATAAQKLTEAFGNEGARVITALAKDTDRFKNSLDQLGKVRGLENAEKMAQAMVDPWQQFGAAVLALRIAFGQSLIPLLTPLMARLTGIAQTLTRWTQLFPNITRVIGIVTLVILGLAGVIATVTTVVGLSKLAWFGLVTVWKLLTWAGFRSIAMFLFHTVMVTLFVAGLAVMYTWMGLVRTGMMLWQASIWLVNAALLANPVIWIIVGIAALVALVVAAVVYWDEWTTALMSTAAFQWVSEQLQTLSDWFGSMSGWSGMASAAWDGIVAIFKDAVSGLIDLLNKIPGVNIETSFSELPKAPEMPGLKAVVSPPEVVGVKTAAELPEVPGMKAAAIPAEVPGVRAAASPAEVPGLRAAASLIEVPGVASLSALPQLPDVAAAIDPQIKERLRAGVGSISPAGPSAVPLGGLLRSIQNTNNSNTQNQGVHVENLNLTNTKPMSQLELENMIGMAVP